MVRLGLAAGGIDVTWSNDWEPAKAAMHESHFGATGVGEYVVADVAEVSAGQLPRSIDLAWASFPCTNLSLAGGRQGLSGSESGTFFQWTRILSELGECERPPVVAAENVVGLASSNGGDDLRAAIAELNGLGYSCDVLVIDARRFVPQSRPRLFVVGTLEAPATWGFVETDVRPSMVRRFFEDPTLRTHCAPLPRAPELRKTGFTAAAERLSATDPRWWDDHRTEAFRSSLSVLQADRLARLIGGSSVSYRTAYRRTRDGVPVWEIRQDDIAGCLRTARGGSSKQAVVRAGRGDFGVRWMTSREYLTLMGAPSFTVDGLRESQILFGCGDAVVVDVVEWLAKSYLVPLLDGTLASHPGEAAA